MKEIESQCPLCPSSPAAVISERARDGSGLTVVLCQECGLARVDPLPDAGELAEFYRENYRLLYKGTYQPKPYHVLRNARVAADRVRQLGDLLAPDLRVLDAGSGSGEFLYLARAAGCRVTGVEPNLGYANYAREELGLEVHVGLVGEQSLNGGSFDRITLYHVLEHLPAPLHALRNLASWLKPEGLLVVEVPNLESTCEHPAHRFHRAHLFYFTPASLSRCGQLAGLAAVRTEVSGDGGNVFMVFRRGEETQLVSQAASLSYRQRGAWRYWLTPATYARGSRRLSRMAGERLAARRYTSRRAILDAVAESVGSRHG
jgi:2-polyprenyl-3-methyl-5-hydroxy-6-metoxy-1,4-benzoquinol methylase